MSRRQLIALAAFLITGGATAFWWQGHRPQIGASLSNQHPVETTPDPTRWLPLFDPALGLPQRLALARTIDASFPLTTLSSWAITLNANDVTQTAENHFILYNEIIEQSRQRNLHPSGLTQFLTAALQNPALHPVLRDYAAQHLALWLTVGSTGQPAEMDSGRLSQALAALCAVIGDETLRHETLPGTVLVALADMQENHTADLSMHWPALDTSIARLISAADTPSALRLSALQAAASAHRTAHLKSIRTLVANAKTDDSVLLSGIAALGALGDATDRPLLESISANGTLASHAARAALQRLPF